jgi:hypothetical protein
MKYANVSIDDLAEVVADEGQFPARMGHKRADSPSFIFRDERGHEDSDTLWGRELALDFEEWCAKREQREQYLSGKLLPAFIHKDNALEFVLATMSEVEEWMDKPIKDKKPVMVFRDEDGVLQEWAPTIEPEALAYFERQDNREFCNWLVSWHKRRPANNDHWRRFVAPLASVLDDKVMGITAQTILKTMRDTLPFAPGPAKETVFVNPDKSRVVTNLQFGKAKEGYKARHGIEDELVTCDRVQYEGERNSRYIIGTRKASDKTASNYYDPDPVEGDRGYIPRACELIRVPASKVLPDENCHILTVRELERAIIAGAELFEDDMEAYAATFEDQDAQFDTREAGISFDDSCDFRTELDFTEEESWLHWEIYGAGLEDAAKAMLVANAGDIARFLPGIDGALLKLGTDQPLTEDEEFAACLLGKAKEEDLLEQERTGRLSWSRFDFLRGLHETSEPIECARYRELVNDAFELNLDVLNNTETRPAYLRW